MVVNPFQTFFEEWRAAGWKLRIFLLWGSLNDALSIALLVGSFLLIPLTVTPGSQQTLLLAFIALAMVWICSIFTIQPVYNYFDSGTG